MEASHTPSKPLKSGPAVAIVILAIIAIACLIGVCIWATPHIHGWFVGISPESRLGLWICAASLMHARCINRSRRA